MHTAPSYGVPTELVSNSKEAEISGAGVGIYTPIKSHEISPQSDALGRQWTRSPTTGGRRTTDSSYDSEEPREDVTARFWQLSEEHSRRTLLVASDESRPRPLSVDPEVVSGAHTPSPSLLSAIQTPDQSPERPRRRPRPAGTEAEPTATEEHPPTDEHNRADDRVNVSLALSRCLRGARRSVRSVLRRRCAGRRRGSSRGPCVERGPVRRRGRGGTPRR